MMFMSELVSSANGRSYCWTCTPKHFGCFTGGEIMVDSIMVAPPNSLIEIAEAPTGKVARNERVDDTDKDLHLDEPS
jgi:hypothetical protein